MALVGEDGKVQLNRNVVDGQEPMLGLIGGLPSPGVHVQSAFAAGHAGGVRGCLRLGLAGGAARHDTPRPSKSAPARAPCPDPINQTLTNVG